MVDLGPSRFAKVQGTSSSALVCTYAIDSIPFVLLSWLSNKFIS